MSRKCDSCGKELALVTHANPKSEQFEDALVLQFDGGYGMYIDIVNEVELRDVRFVLCKDCADKLLAENPFITKVFTHNRWMA